MCHFTFKPLTVWIFTNEQFIREQCVTQRRMGNFFRIQDHKRVKFSRRDITSWTVNRYNQQIFFTKHEIIDRNRIKMYYRMYHNPIVRMTSSRIEHRAWIEFQI